MSVHKVTIEIADKVYYVYYEEYSQYAQVFDPDTELGLFCTFNINNEILISLFGKLYSIAKYDRFTATWISTKKSEISELTIPEN